MSETMTVAQMYEKYPNHWLLILDPVSIPPIGLQSGTVAFASEDRDEMYAEGIRLKPKRFATLCTAKRALGMVMML
jgi:hypothetical protein